MTFARILACLIALLPVPVAAQTQAEGATNPVVVELFTSQGCSSCPPADKLFRELAGRDDVIALALHVDYWDYIGWKDEFADPAYTQRQKSYAREAGRRMIYTPQMIVNGREDIVGAHGLELGELVTRYHARPARARVSLARTGDRLEVEVAPASTPLDGSFVVQIVRFAPERRVAITRGENAGRTIDYANVVQSWAELGQWNGAGPAAFSVDAAGPLRVAVIVQRSGPGAIVAAAQLD